MNFVPIPKARTSQRMETPKTETIERATITSLRFQNEENGWFVAQAQDKRNGEFTVVGEAIHVPLEIEVNLTGQWAHHKTYGRQFKVTHIIFPDNKSAIAGLLSSGLLKGIKTALAKRVVNKFGENTFKVFDEAVENDDTTVLQTVSGLGPNNSKLVITDWRKERGWIQSAVTCFRAGLTLKQSKKAHKKFGNELDDIIINEPYRLISVRSIGWVIADHVAQTSWNGKKAIPLDHPYRLAAAINEMTRLGIQSGHTCIPKDDAVRDAQSELLGLTINLNSGQYFYLIADYMDKVEITEYEGYIYSTYMYQKELDIADKFYHLSATDSALSPVWEKVKDELHKYCDFDLAIDQTHAIEMALKHPLSIITGGPGTGKTTLLSALCNILEHNGISFTLVSPTGKAARRMWDQTGFEAYTIHRALGIFGENVPAKNHFVSKVVIVDETSMVDTSLMWHVVTNLQLNSTLILIGDADQLPPVGPGEPFFQAIEAKVPTTFLTTIHRQSKHSGIVHAARQITVGDIPTGDNYDDFFIGYVQSNEGLPGQMMRLLPKIIEKYNINKDELQILTPLNDHPWGQKELNKQLQAWANPGEFPLEGIPFKDGDKVIHLRNNYELNVMNGQTGIVVHVMTHSDIQNWKSATGGHSSVPIITVDYDSDTVQYSYEDLGELALAYAITIHKSQGSEFEAVFLLIPMTRPNFMLRQLAYTGLTRAKEYCMILSTSRALPTYIQNEERIHRHTCLKEMMEEYTNGSRAKLNN